VISRAIIEEFLEDTKRLSASIVQYADRWIIYGESLEKHASESQRQEIDKAMSDFLFALDQLGVEDLPKYKVATEAGGGE